MRETDPNMAALSTDDRRLVEGWLVAFDEAWHIGRLEESLPKLPAPGHPLRLPTLVEMVKIDIDRNWQDGNKLEVEDYLRELPELGTPDTVAPGLLQAEYLARQDAGDTADLAQFKHRFPKQADKLRDLIKRSLPDAARDSRATPSPAPGKRLAKAVQLPEQFGRYRILRRLGQGGMGAVFLAHDTELDRQVALKVPHIAAKSGELVERFYREARAAAGLSHPNICPLFDVGQIDGICYFTMDYVEGKPLSAAIQPGKPIPTATAAALVRKLAVAIDEAHRKGIIHRDLKPANVMINLRKQPIIMDFGLARQTLSTDTRLTQSGAVVGTPAYMAPEQVRGDDAGPATDVYSLGVILYELLTGKIPFEGQAMAVLGQILTQAPTPPSKHRPDLDPALDKICMQAMAKDPAARFASAQALADALDGALKKSAAPAPGTPRRRWPVWASVALALLGLGLASWAGYVLYVNTGEATVRIEVNDPKAEVKIAIDGEIKITGLGEPITLRAGKHDLVIEGPDVETLTKSFRLRRGDQEVLNVQLIPKHPGSGEPAPPAVTATHGLTAEIFDGANFERRVASRIDSEVHWHFGKGVPDPNVRPGNYSIRWTGYIKAARAGKHRLITQSADGVRLWVGDKLLISDWRKATKAALRHEAEVELSAEPQPIKLEFYNQQGAGGISLRWAEEGDLERVVPKEVLFPSEQAAKAGAQPTTDENVIVMAIETHTRSAKNAGANDDAGVFVLLNQDKSHAHKLLAIGAFRPGSVDRFPHLTFKMRLADVRSLTIFLTGSNAWSASHIRCQFFQGLRKSAVQRFDFSANLAGDGKGKAVKAQLFTFTTPPAWQTEAPVKPAAAAKKLDWFGYHVNATPKQGEDMRELASYTNLVLDHTWINGNYEIVAQAHAAGLKTVLGFNVDAWGKDKVQAFLDVHAKHAGSVAAICAIAPNFKMADLAQLTGLRRGVKNYRADLPFWLMIADDEPPVGLPTEIDGLVVVIKNAPAPVIVRDRVDRYLPGWQKVAAGRPVLLLWGGFDKNGEMPAFEPKTIRTVVDAAQERNLSGVLVGSYGAIIKGGILIRPGVESQRLLVEEAQAIGREMGIRGKKEP